MDFIFDIDGTIANGEQFHQYIQTKPKNWKLFENTLDLHKPILPVVTILHSLLKSNHNVLFVTARSERTRNTTMKWIYDNIQIEYPSLFMRKENDFREDYVIKSEILDVLKSMGYNPVAAFEDVPRVCKMWRERGLKVFDVGGIDHA